MQSSIFLCLSQARINWEGSGRKGIRHKNGGDDGGGSLTNSDTWSVRKENEVALQPAEMRMVRWMCIVKVKDRVPSKELRERLGIDDIILILQQNRLQ